MSLFLRESSPVRTVGCCGAVGVVPDDERSRGAQVDLGGPLPAQQGPLELRDDAPERRRAAPSAVDRYVMYVREIQIPHVGNWNYLDSFDAMTSNRRLGRRGSSGSLGRLPPEHQKVGARLRKVSLPTNEVVRGELYASGLQFRTL